MGGRTEALEKLAGPGAVLESAKAHGPVVHLLLEDAKLYPGTELGDHLVMAPSEGLVCRPGGFAL